MVLRPALQTLKSLTFIFILKDVLVLQHILQVMIYRTKVRCIPHARLQAHGTIQSATFLRDVERLRKPKSPARGVDDLKAV